jgi:hypothetical protein
MRDDDLPRRAREIEALVLPRLRKLAEAFSDDLLTEGLDILEEAFAAAV